MAFTVPGEVRAAPAERSRGLGEGQIAGIALAAVGVVGVAVGSTYGLMAQSSWNHAKALCGDGCAEPLRARAVSERSTAVTDGTVATVGFVAGGALLAGGIALAILAPPARAKEREAGALRLLPAFGAGVAGLDLRGAF